MPTRVMALDWGMQHIGIAVCDELGISTRGLPTLKRKNILHDLEHLTKLIRDIEIKRIVVGKPLNMDGTQSRSSNLAGQFARRLAKHAAVEVEMWDERLTSWEAESIIGIQSTTFGATDQMAAVLLLESYLAANST